MRNRFEKLQVFLLLHRSCIVAPEDVLSLSVHLTSAQVLTPKTEQNVLTLKLKHTLVLTMQNVQEHMHKTERPI